MIPLQFPVIEVIPFLKRQSVWIGLILISCGLERHRETFLKVLTLAKAGLVANIVSFNLGVEIGQALALTAVLIALSYWRTRSGFLQHALLTNTALMTGGFILVGYQLAGYFLSV